MKKQVIILLGPPGAGKGTQAELLSDKLSLYYFETSKILEQEFKNPSEESIEIDGEKFDVSNEKKLWEDGILCSPPFVTYLVMERVKKLAAEGESLVLAGSPRTLYEGERITPLLKELYGDENIKVFLIDISAEQTIFRNTHRRICELMRHPVLYNKETENLKICPLDGSKLIRRKGLDDPETIKIRLKEYRERTFPLIELFGKQGIEVNKINGEQSVSDVHKEILKVIR
ncbi:nucleoside monophosphate kinase [Patescibacteria group bacterium]|nr:nucleoside monophosphate kinase [Patescibacteria group bacterium]